MKIFLLFVLTFSMIASSGFAAESAGNPLPGIAPMKSYQIRNSKYGELLRPENANAANGTPIVLYPAQPWKCMTWKLHSAGDSVFQLQNLFTSKTFAAATNENRITLAQIPFGREAVKRPSWRFVKLSNGHVRIVEAGSGLFITAVRPPDSGVRVVLAPKADSSEQEWELIEIDPARLTM